MARIHANSKLGDYLVAFNIATRSKVDEVRKGLQPKQMFGHALAKAEVCDSQLCEQIVAIKKLYEKTAPRLAQEGTPIVLDKGTVVGDILLALGSVTMEQKEFCAAYQAAQRAKGEDPGRLGKLLLDNNFCSEEQINQAMRVQNWLRGV